MTRFSGMSRWELSQSDEQRRSRFYVTQVRGTSLPRFPPECTSRSAKEVRSFSSAGDSELQLLQPSSSALPAWLSVSVTPPWRFVVSPNA